MRQMSHPSLCPHSETTVTKAKRIALLVDKGRGRGLYFLSFPVWQHAFVNRVYFSDQRHDMATSCAGELIL